MALRIVVVSVMLLMPISAVAQETPTIRVTLTSAIFEQPRGDAAVLAIVTPGTVLEVLAQRGSWYLVEGQAEDWRTGWINQGQVESITGTPWAAPAAQLDQPTRSPADEPSLESGMVELLIDGSFQGLSAGGDTEAAVDLSATVLALVTSTFEVGASASVVKLPGEDTAGSVGGVVVINLRDHGRAIPFVSGGVGISFGFPEPVGNPPLLDVSGGVRVLTPGGRSAFIIRPFYKRIFLGDGSIGDINAFGVRVGLSLFLGG